MSETRPRSADDAAFQARITELLEANNREVERRRAAERRVEELEQLINNPHINEFLEAVRLEAAHQIERWGTAHDRGKQPADWFWLIGYLAGKALAAHIAGPTSKALHHTVSSAAALLNWHAAISGADHRMCPGKSDVEQMIEGAFGPGATS